MEDKVDELEAALRDFMEQNVRVKDELSSAINDNNLLQEHIQNL